MTARKYQPLPPDRPADEVERELLARWEEEDLFHQTLAAHADKPPFVFFEGPPTANGKPGIHHVFARTIKDLFCRHRAMKGFRVDRKAGWESVNFVFRARAVSRSRSARWWPIPTIWKRSCSLK